MTSTSVLCRLACAKLVVVVGVGRVVRPVVSGVPCLCAVMSKIFVRTTGLPMLALMAICIVRDVSADESRIVIRMIYDTGAASLGERAAAIRTAAAIVDEAGLAVDWRDCSDRRSGPSCEQPRRPSDLIVRIMPTAASRATAVDAGFRLGVAVLDPDTRMGEMATILSRPSQGGRPSHRYRLR